MTDIVTEFGLGGGGGVFDGVRPPKAMAGTFIRGPHMIGSATNFVATAALYYMYPIYLIAGDVFAGAAFYNQSAAQSGHKVKIAIYNEAAAGGPGTLAKSFGEVTLTAASAVRQIASSWTVPTTGWYYMELVGDSATNYFGAGSTFATAAAGIVGNATKMPRIIATAMGVAEGISTGFSVAGTYANFPEATSLAFTANVGGPIEFNRFPDFGLYA